MVIVFSVDNLATAIVTRLEKGNTQHSNSLICKKYSLAENHRWLLARKVATNRGYRGHFVAIGLTFISIFKMFLIVESLF